jgi:hypothetical protein
MPIHPINVVNKRKHVGPGIYIGRPSPLGNPFTAKDYGKGIPVASVEESIKLYEIWLMDQIKTNPSVRKALNEILNQSAKEPVNLICWCAPGPCHGDVIKKFINNIVEERNQND